MFQFVSDMPIIAILIALLTGAVMVTLYPLAAAVAVGRAYWKRNQLPPWQLGIVLWLLAAVAAVALGQAPLRIPLFSSVPAVAGILACAVAGGAILLSRWRKSSYRRSLRICSVLGVCVLVWADLRFCIVIRDADGRLLGAAAAEHDGTGRPSPRAFHLEHEVEDAWVTVWDYARGKEVLDGVIYIGLFQWLEWRSGWSFSGQPGLDFRDCTWDAWPAKVRWPPRF